MEWIKCNKCKWWFHLKCLGYDRHPDLLNDWFCSDCEDTMEPDECDYWDVYDELTIGEVEREGNDDPFEITWVVEVPTVGDSPTSDAQPSTSQELTPEEQPLAQRIRRKRPSRRRDRESVEESRETDEPTQSLTDVAEAVLSPQDSTSPTTQGEFPSTSEQDGQVLRSTSPKQ